MRSKRNCEKERNENNNERKQGAFINKRKKEKNKIEKITMKERK